MATVPTIAHAATIAAAQALMNAASSSSVALPDWTAGHEVMPAQHAPATDVAVMAMAAPYAAALA
jgi:hypothetical protein